MNIEKDGRRIRFVCIKMQKKSLPVAYSLHISNTVPKISCIFAVEKWLVCKNDKIKRPVYRLSDSL